MNRSIALLGVLLIAVPFIGCGKKEEPAPTQRAKSPAAPPSPGTNADEDSTESDDAAADTTADMLRFDDPIFPDSSAVIFLPVRLDEDDDDEASGRTIADKVRGAMKSPSPARNGASGIANVIIVDKRTGASHPLLDHPALIARFEMLPGIASKAPIIYAIVDRDTDGDSALTVDDEEGCYLSDGVGNGLHRITEPGVSVRNWFTDDSTIYLRVLADANHDGSFDEDDGAEQILRYDIGGTGMARRVVADSLVAATIAIARKPLHPGR